MKKVIIIEECDYDRALNELHVAKDFLKSMRRGKNSLAVRVEHHIDDAIEFLTGEDSSVKDLKHRIEYAEASAIPDWR